MGDRIGTVVSVSSILFIVLSAVFTLGYFGAADMRYVYFLGPSDYVSSFVSNAPHIFLPMLLVLVLWALYDIWLIYHPPKAKAPLEGDARVSWIRSNLILTGVFIFATALTVFFKLSWSVIAILLWADIILISDLYKGVQDKLVFDPKTMRSLLQLASVGVLVFLSGNSEGEAQLKCEKPDTSVTMGTAVYRGCIFWIMSDGILFSQGGDGAIFYFPKSHIDGISSLGEK
jgi:hypothetical protein